MAVFDATKEGYMLAEIDGKPVLFTNMRLDRDTVPEGLFVMMYGILMIWTAALPRSNGL